jgi:hypothetical protein
MIMELLAFVFGSGFWRFIGCFMILGTVAATTISIAAIACVCIVAPLEVFKAMRRSDK